VVAISHTLSVIYWNNKDFSGSLVEMEYYSKFIIFTGATPPQKMKIWWRSVSN
jgi:hypothetical protein